LEVSTVEVTMQRVLRLLAELPAQVLEALWGLLDLGEVEVFVVARFSREQQAF